ncbi:MAG: type II toxin-antitoxin system death-on-curing family toxin [Chloroflexota bacterium]
MGIIVLKSSEILAIQKRTIDQHGGIHGVRDQNAFESAIAAVENRIHYEEADVVTCAATYAYHLVQAHAFLDGNKRVAAATTLVFLHVNGYELNMSHADIIQLFLDIAAGKIERDRVEKFIKSNASLR